MAVQVSYPGVYIEEFTPGPPIEGVGTSTVGFIGTAQKGPIREATRLHSWEAFKATFGDFLAEQPASWLAPAVYGFFLNGGTDCFIVREGTGAYATAKLLSRKTPNPDPVLLAEALEEGALPNDISVEVIDASILDDKVELERFDRGDGASQVVRVLDALHQEYLGVAAADSRRVNGANVFGAGLDAHRRPAWKGLVEPEPRWKAGRQVHSDHALTGNEVDRANRTAGEAVGTGDGSFEDERLPVGQLVLDHCLARRRGGRGRGGGRGWGGCLDADGLADYELTVVADLCLRPVGARSGGKRGSELGRGEVDVQGRRGSAEFVVEDARIDDLDRDVVGERALLERLGK